MGKSNVAESTANVAAEVAEVKTVEAVTAPVMIVMKNLQEEPRKLSLNEKIQRVEDLRLLIDRWRTLKESCRNLQIFRIGADSNCSVNLLRDAVCIEIEV